ncbi:DUF4159 domain-containing protein, partial [Candidatus Poribacteria bacterium]|nr:DUF4159 domain-containing protein [Candidatus Poribacteria bacterium]
MKKDTMFKLFSVCSIFFFLLLSTQGAGERFTIAQIQYAGGGDWYGDPSAIRNWLNILRERTDIDTAEDRII